MKREETGLEGVVLYTPEVYEDNRGHFYESFNDSIDFDIKQMNCSLSRDNILRGIHGQVGQSKLVSVVKGGAFDFAIDLREDSPTYKQYVKRHLSENNHSMLLIPDGFGHAFYTPDGCTLSYAVNSTYDPTKEWGIRWDDPQLNIDWFKEITPVVSERDRKLPYLKR
jgi:dTDP-4-dehydrorhamnose 3,5-epimerase